MYGSGAAAFHALRPGVALHVGHALGEKVQQQRVHPPRLLVLNPVAARSQFVPFQIRHPFWHLLQRVGLELTNRVMVADQKHGRLRDLAPLQ